MSGIPKDWGAEEIAAEFRGDRLAKVKFLEAQDNTKTKNAIFTYSTDVDASKAISAHHKEGDFHFISYISDYTEKMNTAEEEMESRRLVVYGLPDSMTEA